MSISTNILVNRGLIDEWVSESLLDGITCIDGTINIICLYLQFPFTQKYYNKYCMCFRDCCMYLIARNTFRSGTCNGGVQMNRNTDLVIKSPELQAIQSNSKSTKQSLNLSEMK